jgi:hypothetical protein
MKAPESGASPLETAGHFITGSDLTSHPDKMSEHTVIILLL